MKRKGEKVFAEVINYLILSAFVKTKEDDGIPAWICTASPEKDHKLFSNGSRRTAKGSRPAPHIPARSDICGLNLICEGPNLHRTQRIWCQYPTAARHHRTTPWVPCPFADRSKLFWQPGVYLYHIHRAVWMLRRIGVIVHLCSLFFFPFLFPFPSVRQAYSFHSNR